MNLIDAVQLFLGSLPSGTRNFYSKGAQVNLLDFGTKKFSASRTPEDPLSTLFGFVPVFTKSGKTVIYVRFGGPEVIRKLQGSYNQDPDVAYGRYDTIPNSMRDGAGYEFGDTHRGVFSGATHNTLYAMDHAFERDILQYLEVGVRPQDREYPVLPSLADLRNIYKFKLVPDDDKFEVYYSRSGLEYAPLKSDPDAYAAFGIDLILDSLDVAFLGGNVSPQDGQTLLQSAKTTHGQTKAVEEFLGKLAEDFYNTALEGVSFGEYHYLQDDALDQLWWSALKQFDAHSTANTLEEIESLSTDLERIDTVLPVCADRLKVSLDQILAGYALDSESAVEVIRESETFRKDAEALRVVNRRLKAQNEALKSEANHTSVHRYVGLTAGAASAYLSVRSTDMEDWQKIGVVALGGVLGMVPILNYFTIASTPLAVHYGAEYLKNRESSVVRSPLALSQTSEA